MKQTANFPDTQTESAVQTTAHSLALFRRILVPTDFSQRSALAIDYAVELARRMNAQLTLLHVLPEPSALDYNIGGFPPEELAKAKEGAEQKLAAELAHAKLTLLEVDSKLQTGVDLHDEILGTAKQISADLLVLSTHGYTGWKHLLFGSDAEKILQHAPCPILVVR
jgi:universal stress protein A